MRVAIASRWIVVASLVGTLVACDKLGLGKKKDEESDSTSADTTAAAETTATASATASASASASASSSAAPASSDAVASDAPVGVQECDDFLTKYEKCVSTKVPEGSRKQIEDSVKQMRDSFRQIAGTEGGKATLATACKQSLDTVKKAMASWGCDWGPSTDTAPATPTAAAPVGKSSVPVRPVTKTTPKPPVKKRR